ncbi:MAG TPA: hypothetical protein HA254_07175 [Candidatus Diapherotrites archaeon]|uniref:Uncharacterized protein n=1 Tax=Candidatus Iainarchaeum sp. TaxID=3101447 RepID=A0A7J4J2W0_9ARCH|nr:hypothetical protein [Candidatus Diapherotrites archaeon]
MKLVLLEGLLDSLWIVLTLFLFVWIYGWAKENLGSAKLAILFALIVVYLTFYSYPFLVWLLVIFFLIQTFGKEFISQINPYGGDQLR